jgi:hypothetical protein
MATTKTKFFFDHIPKTAGVSLDAAFRNLFTQYRRLEQVSNSHRHAVLHPDLNYIGGHIYFYPNEALSSEHYYCTVLRDPTQRFISQYFFNRQSFESLLAQGAVGDPIMNEPQVLMSVRFNISELILQEGPIRRSFSNTQAIHFASRLSSLPFDLDDKALEDAAIASLEAYDLVGSFEKIQDFVDTIASDFGVSSVAIERLNVTRPTSDRHRLPQSVLDALARLNVVDAKLIHWAEQRFGWNSKCDRRSAVKPVYRLAMVLDEAAEEAITKSGFDSQQIKIIKAKCSGEKSNSIVVDAGEAVIVDVSIDALVAEADLTIGIALRDREGRLAYGVNSKLLGISIAIEKPGIYQAKIRLNNHLGAGAYSVTLALHKGWAHTEGCFHWLDAATSFAVCATGHPFEGYVNCQAEIALLEAPSHD